MRHWERQERAAAETTCRTAMFRLLRDKRRMEADIRRLPQPIEERDITIARLKREEESTITFLRNREARLRGEAR